MEIENSIRKSLPFSAGILVLLAFTVTFIHAFIPINHYVGNHSVFVYFFGINLILIVIGTLLLAFYLIRQWIIYIVHANELAEKKAENTYKLDQQKLLNADAEARRAIERERNPINDLFQLAELSKIKTEKTTVRKEAEKPKEPITISETNKKEEINIQELNRLLEHYQGLISTQQAKTT